MLIECYNPNPGPVTVTLTIRSGTRSIPYELLIPLRPGYGRERIATDDIATRVDIASPLDLCLMPNVTKPTTLFFGAIDFVHDESFPSLHSLAE